MAGRVLNVGCMDAARSPDSRAEPFDVASLVCKAGDDALPEDAPIIDIAGDLNAIQISTIVAAQAGGVALSPADSADVGVVGDDAQFDALAFVPDRRTADRLALAISDWAARQGPTVIDFLYHANARCGQLPTPEGQADAIESLEACQHVLDLSEPPSRDRYRVWFERQPAEMEWSKPSTIEIACGNWSRARAAAAGEPLVLIGAVRAGRLGGYSSTDALLELLRQWHAAEPDERRRFRVFRVWVLKSLEGSNAATLAARVISKHTFSKRFGSWVEALAQAGLLEGVSFEVFKRLVGTPRKNTVECLEAAIHEWSEWDRVENRGLTIKSLSAWRESVLRQRWKECIPEGVPDVGALISQWGSFLDALVAVGLITADEALRRRLVRGDRLTRDEIAALIRSAHRENGGTLDRAAWRRFRTGTARETGRSVPHETTVVDRLDAVDFDAAVAIALRMAPVDTDERKIS
jgi:hypothetical protein